MRKLGFILDSFSMLLLLVLLLWGEWILAWFLAKL